MALSYLHEDMSGSATFSLFVRDLPAERGFLVSAGTEPALEYLSAFRITSADVGDFASALHRPYADVAGLCGITFTGEVRAVPEGRVVFAGEPLLEVTAPLAQAQLVETFLLNQVSHQTAVASKAVRSVLAASGRPVVDFSLRRTHGTSAGMQAARTTALTGFAGTSNVAAAVRWGLPASGTMAHSYVEAFPDEEAAFRAFARAHSGPVTFLVDTYDAVRGGPYRGSCLARSAAWTRLRRTAGQRRPRCSRPSCTCRAGQRRSPRSPRRRQRRPGRIRRGLPGPLRGAHRRVRGRHPGGYFGRRPLSGFGLQTRGVRRPSGHEAVVRQSDVTRAQTGFPPSRW